MAKLPKKIKKDFMEIEKAEGEDPKKEVKKLEDRMTSKVNYSDQEKRAAKVAKFFKK